MSKAKKPPLREMTAAEWNEFQAKTMLEAPWQEQIITQMIVSGFNKEDIYHTYDSRRSREGFPDLVAFRDYLVISQLQLVVEVKREKGKVTEPQARWLTHFARQSVRDPQIKVAVWRPTMRDAIWAFLEDPEKEIPGRWIPEMWWDYMKRS